MSALPTTARWFNGVGRCANCGLKATGWLMNGRNDKLGPYCHRCAAKALKASDKALDAANRKTASA